MVSRFRPEPLGQPLPDRTGILLCNLGTPDAPTTAATRRYLTVARRLLESCDRATDFYQRMLALHPGRINPGALWGAALTLFPRA